MRFTGLFIGVSLTAKFPEIPMIYSKDLKFQRERERERCAKLLRIQG